MPDEAQVTRRQQGQATYRYEEPKLEEAQRVYDRVKDAEIVQRTERVLFNRVKKRAEQRGIRLTDEQINELVHRKILRWIDFLMGAGISEEKIEEMFKSDVWKNEGKKALIGSITFAKLLVEGKFTHLWGQASQKRIEGFLEDAIFRYEQKREGQGSGFGQQERLEFNPADKSFEQYYPQWREENATVLERIAKKLHNGDLESLSKDAKERLYRLIYEELWFNYLYGGEDEEEQTVEQPQTEAPMRAEAPKAKTETKQRTVEERAGEIIDRIEEVYGPLNESKKKQILENLIKVLKGESRRVDFGLRDGANAKNLLKDEKLKQLLEAEQLEIRITKEELEGGEPGVSLAIAPPRS